MSILATLVIRRRITAELRGSLRFRLQIPGRTGAAMLLGFLCWSNAFAQSAPSTDDFANKSIEELMNIDVTSVSRKEQKLSKIPAAVYVITREAIQRSGATTIPDLLRMVPGVQVAQIEANRWAISVRGFNGIYSNKLLVLIDGRTIYTPSFSGVYWNQVDVPLDTIERIEVVRGPGGTVWGANAVNGVINIITEKSQSTQGTRISAGAGSFQTGDYEARFGSKLGHLGAYRVFGDFSSFGNLQTARGQNGHDGWQIAHGGFRADLDKSAKDAFTFTGNVFRTDGGQTIAPAGLTAIQPLNDHGFDVMGRWTHKHSDTSESSLQISGSSYSRMDSGFTEKVNTADFDFQNHLSLGSRNDVVWGLGYRLNSDNIENYLGQAESFATMAFYPQFLPARKNYSLFSTFFQDEIALTSKLALTVGSKVEHNAFTGFEFEPNARLAWMPNDKHTVWAAVSQAVRQPSRLDTAVNAQFPVIGMGNGLALTEEILGNPRFQAETVRAYEAGYRTTVNRRVSLDVSTFYNFYRALESSSLSTPKLTLTPGSAVITLPFYYGNGAKAQTYGGEASVTWNAASRWRWNLGYSMLQAHVYSTISSAVNPVLLFSQTLPPAAAKALSEIAGSINISGPAVEPAPKHQFSVQSYLDLSSKMFFDSAVFFVDHLEGTGISAYTRVDAHLTYKPRKGIEISLVGQNLLSPRHAEFPDAIQAVHTDPERSIFGRVIWTF